MLYNFADIVGRCRCSHKNAYQVPGITQSVNLQTQQRRRSAMVQLAHRCYEAIGGLTPSESVSTILIAAASANIGRFPDFT